MTTPNIVPSANNQGKVGREGRRWLALHAQTAAVDTALISGGTLAAVNGRLVFKGQQLALSSEVGGGGGGGATDLDELTDVELDFPIAGQALVYEMGRWTNKTLDYALPGSVTSVASDLALARQEIDAVEVRVDGLEERMDDLEGSVPAGTQGVLQAASADGTALAEAVVRSVFTSETVEGPSYTTSGAEILIYSNSPSASLVSGRHHRWDGLTTSQATFILPDETDGEFLSFRMNSFDANPMWYVNFGSRTTRAVLRKVEDPNDITAYTQSNTTNLTGQLWLSDKIPANTTFYFWYVLATDAWYYSSAGFPSSSETTYAASLEPAYAESAEYPAVNLGSPTRRFGTLYLKANTIDLGGTQLSIADGQLVVSGDEGQTSEPFATEAYVTSAVSTLEGALETQLDAKADAAATTASLNTLTTSINAEVTNRQAAVTAEANTRSAADTTLQANIDAEAVARQTAITNALTGYVTAASHTAALALKLSITSFNQFVSGTLNTQLNSKMDEFVVGEGLVLDNGVLSAEVANLDGYVTDAELTAAVASANEYTDDRFDALVGSGTLTAALDTLIEIAEAIETNQDAVDAINAAILSKADKSTTLTAGPGVVTAGSLGSGVTVSLAASGVVAKQYGSSSAVPRITVDTYGRITAATLVALPVGFSGSYNDLTDKPNFAAVATSGSYADLAGAPVLSAVATSGSYADLAGAPVLSAVATSGNYADLAGAPTLSAVATSGNYADLAGAPTLSAVATSGNYADLAGAPTLSAVATSGNYADLGDLPDLSVYATSASLTALSGRVSNIEGGGYLTSASTLSAAQLDTPSFTVQPLGIMTPALTVTLGETVTAASLANVLRDSLSIKDNLSALVDVQLAPVALEDGQYLKYSAGVGKWVAGDVEDFTTGVTSVNGQSGAVTLDIVSPQDLTDALANYVTSATLGAELAVLSGDLALKLTAATFDAFTAALPATIDRKLDASSFTSFQAANAAALGLLDDAISDVTDGLAGKQDSFNIGRGLELSAGTLQTDFDIGSYVTASSFADSLALKLTAATFTAFVNALPATLDNYALVADVSASFASVSSSLSAVTADLSAFTASANGRLDTAEGGIADLVADLADEVTARGVAVTAESVARAAADDALQDSIDTKQDALIFGAGLLLQGGTLTAVPTDLSGYVTAASFSAEVLALEGADAALQDAIDEKLPTATFTAFSISVGGSLTALSAEIAGKQDSFAVGGGIELVGGTLQTTFDIADYATSASLTAATASIGAALDLKLSIAAFNDYTAGTLTDALSAKADAAALSAYTFSAGLRFNDVEADVVSLGGSLATLTTDLASLTGDVAAYTLATNGRLDAVEGDVLDLSGELGGLTTSLADEVADRAAADITLQGNIDAKQDQLTAGSNISLVGATIAVSATLSNAVAANTAKIGFTDALARAAISAGGDLSYDNTTGVVSYSSAWAQSGGVVTASVPVVITGYMLELFEFGDAPLNQAPVMTLDGGNLSSPVDRIVDLGTLDQGRLF